MYLHEVMKKPKSKSLNKVSGDYRSVSRNVSSTLQSPVYLARGMAMGK